MRRDRNLDDVTLLEQKIAMDSRKLIFEEL